MSSKSRLVMEDVASDASRKSSWDIYARDAPLKGTSPQPCLEVTNNLSDLKSEKCPTTQAITIMDHAVLANCEHR